MASAGWRSAWPQASSAWPQEVIAEGPLDAAVVQVRQRAAALLLVSGSVHAMDEPQGRSVCATDQQVQWINRPVIGV